MWSCEPRHGVQCLRTRRNHPEWEKSQGVALGLSSLQKVAQRGRRLRRSGLWGWMRIRRVSITEAKIRKCFRREGSTVSSAAESQERGRQKSGPWIWQCEVTGDFARWEQVQEIWCTQDNEQFLREILQEGKHRNVTVTGGICNFYGSNSPFPQLMWSLEDARRRHRLTLCSTNLYRTDGFMCCFFHIYLHFKRRNFPFYVVDSLTYVGYLEQMNFLARTISGLVCVCVCVYALSPNLVSWKSSWQSVKHQRFLSPDGCPIFLFDNLLLMKSQGWEFHLQMVNH